MLLNGISYRSKKHFLLEHIFDQKTSNGTQNIGQNITFILDDISRAYQALGMKEPASISNTILDLTRQDRGIASRLPTSIVTHGYDLRKKTGTAGTGKKYAGEFVFVGVGKALRSWHVWGNPSATITIRNCVPPEILPYLGKDEGAMFSVIDYCDVLSLALLNTPDTIMRVQNPKKWQPNELDGLYMSDVKGIVTLYPSEAKALSTGDAINLEQLLGGYRVTRDKIPNVKIDMLALQMIVNGIDIGVFTEVSGSMTLQRHVQVKFNPPIANWT